MKVETQEQENTQTIVTENVETNITVERNTENEIIYRKK
jgi:hypothetical protein